VHKHIPTIIEHNVRIGKVYKETGAAIIDRAVIIGIAKSGLW
jgi:hypothetical protein